MKDFLGRDIQVGDRIVYATRRGSDMRLRAAVVLEDTNGSLKVGVKPLWTEGRDTVRLTHSEYIALLRDDVTTT